MATIKTQKQVYQEYKKKRDEIHGTEKKHVSMNKQRKQTYYNMQEWKQLSQLHRRKNPLCQCCLVEDTITPSEQTHHIIKFDDQNTDALKLRLLLDFDNLVCLCSHCHQVYHNNKEDLTDKQIQWFKDKKEEVKSRYEECGIYLNDWE